MLNTIPKRLAFWRILAVLLLYTEARYFETAPVLDMVPLFLTYAVITVIMEWLIPVAIMHRFRYGLIVFDFALLGLYTYLRREFEVPIINFFVFIIVSNSIIILSSLRKSVTTLWWSVGMFAVTYLALLYFYLWQYLEDMRIVLGGPLIVAITGFASDIAIRGSLKAQKEAHSRARLSRFLSPDIIKELDRNTVGDGRFPPTDKEVTILFADIRGFTTLAETMPPAETLEVLNTFIDHATRSVFHHRGTVDKYIGDCVMALFGAPLGQADDAPRAVRAAIEMANKIHNWKQSQNTEHLPEIKVGIGINTSTVLAGTVGSQERIEYTVIGDGVNVASRVSDFTKKFDYPIILTEATYELLPENLKEQCQFIGEESVRGRANDVKCYGLLPQPEATP